MRGKTQVVKPEIEKLQDKLKNADTQEERTAANKLLMKKYNDYGINPFKTLVGTLPILIQIPILLGLYACIKYPTSGGIIEHLTFMVQFNAYGFNHDIYSSFTLLHSTFGQCNALSKRRKTHILCHDGIIAIIYYLCITTICFSLKFILGDKCNVFNYSNAFCT